MTIKQLLAKLKELGDQYGHDTEVVFAYPAGDYWHTIVAEKIQSIDAGEVEWSAYHRKYEIVDDPEDSEIETKTVIIIE